VIGSQHKAAPPAAWGRTLADAPEAQRRSGWQTPLLTLDRAALDHNVATMFDWLRENGIGIAPHGKTTMAPQLWGELLDAGAWGITVATGWQAQAARAAGVRNIMIANTCSDPVALRWIADEHDRHRDVRVLSWVDGIQTVDAMARVLRDAGAGRPMPVIVELGASGGRTGARTLEEALAVADAVASSTCLELAGVGGYEGALAHDRSESGIARVDEYLRQVGALHRELVTAGRYSTEQPIVTAGGSAYFDRVAAVLGGTPDATVLLRSGAFQVHDDGFYRSITPMGTLVGSRRFRSAMHAWVRVVSRPEPGLALFDAGKRDLPFDEGLPIPLRLVGAEPGLSDALVGGARVTALNDQHGFLYFDPALSDALPVGSVLQLGLSHPCTALDKWRLIPVVDDATLDDPKVIDTIETVF
jgi:D-serine deaminase-like pyridoxal phosphate-dependent protein